MSERTTTEVKEVQPTTEQPQSAQIKPGTRVLESEPPVPQAPQPPVIKQPVQAKPGTRVMETVRPVPEQDSFETSIALMRTQGTADEKYIISAMDQYLENMAPGRPTHFADGVRHQYNLWLIINHVLTNAPESAFNKLWTILVGYVKAHQNGSFGIRYAHRFTEHWTYSAESVEALSEMINLLTATARDGKQRAVRLVSLEKATKVGISDTGRGRLMRFYEV